MIKRRRMNSGNVDQEYSYYSNNLSYSINRKIRRYEKDTGRNCRRIWSFTNPKGEQYIFGSFVINYTDKVIITLAYWEYRIHGFLSHTW